EPAACLTGLIHPDEAASQAIMLVSPLKLVRKLVRRPTVPRRGIMIALVLVCVFSVAIIMRAFPAKYGFYLNEFDPYYDYKATNFIVTSFDNSWKSGGGGFP